MVPPVQLIQFRPSVLYSMSAVTPVIVPSLPLVLVGAAAVNMLSSGAACACSALMVRVPGSVVMS